MGCKRKLDNDSNSSDAQLLKRTVSEEEEDDSQTEIDVQSQNALNPLFLFEILPTMFSYLNVANLKRCRLVCKLWGFEGGKILLKNSNLNLDHFVKREEEIKQIANFINTNGICASLNLEITDMEGPHRLKNTLPMLLQQTACLLLKTRNCSNSNTTLVQFLEFFPHLKILVLVSNWGFKKDFSPEIKRCLLTKFESLKEIRWRIRERPLYPLINLLLTKPELAVKEIHLQDNASMVFEKYLQSKCNWLIEALDLDIKLLSPELLNTIGAFLEKISGSLNYLRLDIRRSQNVPDEYLVPWANNLINPSTFSGLETLEISYGRWNFPSYDFSWLLFTFALQLRNLKELTLDRLILNGTLEERIREWNDHPNAKGRTLESESLEKLEIIHNGNKMPVKNLIIFSRRLWPNLKSLRMENPPHNLPTSFLLSEWIGLERLDFKFKTMNKSEANLWTSWFTGEKPKDENASQDDAHFSINGLKDLKHFGLWENRCEKLNRVGTDVLAVNSLKFMTQLQSLWLAGAQISQGVGEMLKETLGPNVDLDIS